MLDTLIGAAAALIGAGLGAFLVDFLSRRRQREERRDAERALWREETATVLAQVRALLEEYNQERVRYAEVRKTLSREIRPQWQDIQHRMLRIYAVHPSPRVRELTWNLIMKGSDYCTYVVNAYAGTRDGALPRAEYGNEYYEAAEEAWQNLRAEIQFKDVDEKSGFLRSGFNLIQPMGQVYRYMARERQERQKRQASAVAA